MVFETEAQVQATSISYLPLNNSHALTKPHFLSDMTETRSHISQKSCEVNNVRTRYQVSITYLPICVTVSLNRRPEQKNSAWQDYI